MLKVERQQLILKYLFENSKATIIELSSILNVSKETIRRDILELSRDGQVTKVHGGVVKKEYTTKYEPGFIDRKAIRLESKIIIAKKAVNEIKDNEIIAFGIGTTVAEIVNELRGKKNLTILVSCVRCLNILINKINSGEITGKVIFTGGLISTHHMAALGEIAEKVVRQFNIDKAFVGCNGLTLENGVSTFDLDDGNLLKNIIKKSKKIYLVLDDSKFYFDSLYKYSDIEDIDRIISNVSCPKDLETLKKKWI